MADKPISDKDLEKFEHQIGAKLPIAFREFLQKYNGGVIRPSGFRYANEGIDNFGYIRHFFSITDENEYNSLLKQFKMSQSYLPNRLLPIADDGLGNLICISIKGSDIGKIYFADHDIPEEEEENLFVIADNFVSFLESLSEYTEDNE